MTIRLRTIHKICCYGLLVRLVALAVVCIFSHNLTTGYLRSNYESDDLRYLDGAITYSKMASSVIDVDAFVNAFLSFSKYNDNTAYSDDIALWYWIMCILAYFFRFEIILKIINILFGVWCIALIYKLCKLLYPEKPIIGKTAALLYAFFPYPVFFSCFLYKDQFLTLITLAIFYITYNSKTIFSPLAIIKLGLLLLTFTLIRSGLVPLLLLCIGYIEYYKRERSQSKNSIIKKIFIIGIFLILAIIFYFYFFDTIYHKFQAYVNNRALSSEVAGSTISYFLMNSPLDFWKAPFAFVFTTIQPLYRGGGITNWEHIVSIINFCSIPVIIVNFWYVFQKKSNKIFWRSIMAIFFVMLIVSMGITRHFYYLLPYIFIFYAEAIYSGKPHIKSVNISAITFASLYAMLFIVPSILIL